MEKKEVTEAGYYPALTPEANAEHLTAADIQKLAAAAGVDTPVTSVRVVGNRVELHLLGGTVALVSPTEPDESSLAPKAAVPTTGQHSTTVTQHVPPLDDLQAMNVRQLHQLAADLGLSGYSRLKKDELIEAIDNAR